MCDRASCSTWSSSGTPTVRLRPTSERPDEDGCCRTGLTYVDSWVVDDDQLDTCYQLMETDDPGLFEGWLSNWNDLGEFVVVPVIKSAEAAARVDVSWGGP